MFGLLGTSIRAKQRQPKSPPKAPPKTHETIEVSGRSVKILRRPYKRSLGLTLKMNGQIRVSAPVGLPVSKIRDFVITQETWIKTHLAKYETLRESYPTKVFTEGESFLFLGKTLTLAFEAVSSSARPCFKIRGDQLVCGIRKEVWHLFDPKAHHPELRVGLASFYQKQARQLLTERVAVYAARMQLVPSSLSFRAQKTRWGSCSSRGQISLNWKLMIAPLEVIDYVVAHELAHLKYHDHSKSFWSLVETHVSDYRERRQWLRERQFDADFLNMNSELR